MRHHSIHRAIRRAVKWPHHQDKLLHDQRTNHGNNVQRIPIIVDMKGDIVKGKKVALECVCGIVRPKNKKYTIVSWKQIVHYSPKAYLATA